MPETSNPLLKHFRQPQLYLRLPSDGKWWYPASLELPVTKEIVVYAMTARDELLIKTPDALLNGQATVDVIQSCCPNIKDAWKTPTVDIDAILIAIRRATYGNRMDFTSLCPHCSTKNEHSLDLDILGSNISCPNFDETLTIGDLEIFLKPLTYQHFNQNSIRNYDEQRLLSVVQDETLGEKEKLAQFGELFRGLLDITVSQVANNVGAIKMSTGETVDSPEFLKEFFSNCDREVWTTLKDHIVKLNEHSELKRVPLKCEEEKCLKDYTAPLVFEHSSFFE